MTLREIITPRALRLVPLALLCAAMISCGSNPAPLPPNLTTNLNGNWNLGGNRSLQQYPVLAVALNVSGNQITAQGDMLLPCVGAPGGVGSTLSLAGQIAPDGTFQLAQVAPRGISIVLDGTVPKDTTTWSGSYTATDSPGVAGCSVNQTGAFVATPLTPLTGIFTGALAGTVFGTGVTVSLQVAQGAPIVDPRPSAANEVYYPLNATITVQGSPCFKQGTTGSLNVPRSYIGGDFIYLSFIMDDGSNLIAQGWMADSTETTFSPINLTTLGNSSSAVCGFRSSSLTLTRQ
jgi:hypothetical protein